MLIQNKYKSGTRNKSMNSEMMSLAESTIIRHVQKKFYGEEMEALRVAGSVNCSSNLSKLMPRLKGTDQAGTFIRLKCVVYYANYRSWHQSSKIQVVS